MDNPGPFTLGDFQIGAPGTQQTPATQIPSLVGMSGASLQVRLSGGTGGSTINVFIQTSIDQGQSWFDVANVSFATTPGVQVLNLSGLDKAVPVTPGNLTLSSGTILDGPLGDRLQAVVISTGTYGAGTLVSVRGVAR